MAAGPAISYVPTTASRSQSNKEGENNGKSFDHGNEALAESCLRAGCRFFSGYPITPQSAILEYLSWRMDELGGNCVQTESELAGINMLLGAASAGAVR